MSLADRLLDDMKMAMKAKEAGKVRLATIRMVRAAQKELEITKKRQLTDEEMLDIINREMKKRSDVIADYERANRSEDVIRLHEEIRVLKEYLPEQLGKNEIKIIVEKVIEQTGASGPRDMGKVMQAVMPELKGKADGKLVNQLVKDMLQQ